MKKKRKNLVRVDCSSVGLLDSKPPRQERPKCLQCDNTITMRSTLWYDSPIRWQDRPVRYYYDGISYFCSRNCCMAYAHNMATKELKVSKVNSIKNKV